MKELTVMKFMLKKEEKIKINNRNNKGKKRKELTKKMKKSKKNM
jgi:hypothetical protein